MLGGEVELGVINWSFFFLWTFIFSVLSPLNHIFAFHTHGEASFFGSRFSYGLQIFILTFPGFCGFDGKRPVLFSPVFTCLGILAVRV